jgi:type IV pilus assembly protein PilB
VLAVPKAIWSLVPERLIRDRVVFPVGLEGQLPGAWLLVATSVPSDLAMADEIAFATGLRVKLVEASTAAIGRLIALHLGGGGGRAAAAARAPDRFAPIELPEEDGQSLRREEWVVPLAPGETKWR